MGREREREREGGGGGREGSVDGTTYQATLCAQQCKQNIKHSASLGIRSSQRNRVYAAFFPVTSVSVIRSGRLRGRLD